MTPLRNWRRNSTRASAQNDVPDSVVARVHGPGALMLRCVVRVRLPVVMCAHPYDNGKIPARGTTPFGGPPVQYRIIPQVGRPRFSTLTSWEAPDPDFWVRAGYAVVNLNLPG